MKFSICVPNYNYARYIGQTVASALDQTHRDLEVHVVDNDSTDDSVAVLETVDDPRFSFDRNNCNVGLAPNLDRAVDGTTGDWIILLSSDDLMKPDALETYQRIIEHMPNENGVISSTCEVVDGDGEPVGLLRPPDWCWYPVDIDTRLTTLVGAPTYRVEPAEVLRRSLIRMRNPLWFASTAYPRTLYDKVEGYRGQGLMNPDKQFHWRLIGVTDWVVFVDAPLFSYRVHGSNQNSQEVSSGALKRLVDQYVLSFNTDEGVRDRAGLTGEDLARNFVREDIAKRAIYALVRDDVEEARRAVSFGVATYPELMRSEPWALVARGLVASRWLSGPALSMLAGPLGRRQLAQSYLIREGRPDGSV